VQIASSKVVFRFLESDEGGSWKVNSRVGGENDALHTGQEVAENPGVVTRANNYHENS
jgi:hypothetical protein